MSCSRHGLGALGGQLAQGSESQPLARSRKDASAIEHLGIAEILDSYDAIIRQLEHPPIIMGHSFGGAFTEILIDRGLGAAGVAIDAAAVRGVTKLPLSTLKSGFPILKNPTNKHHAVPLTLEEFEYAFANTMSAEDQRLRGSATRCPGPVVCCGKARLRTSTRARR